MSGTLQKVGARSLRLSRYAKSRVVVSDTISWALHGRSSYRCKSTLSASNKEEQPKRHPTAWERIKNFSPAAMQLWRDCLTYRDINDASKTPRNAWTTSKVWVHDNQVLPGRIPRRQREEQRLIKQDVRTVLPTILIWLLPLVGYLPLFFAVVFPRVLLSRQFHTDYEIETYACLEYRQRRGYYKTLGDYFWDTLMINVSTLQIPVQGEDAAGPILDILPFYRAFASTNDESEAQVFNYTASTLQLPTGVFCDMDSFPREHLITLALASGVNQSFRVGWNYIVTTLAPSFYLRQSVSRIANEISIDDELLLEEGHDENGCESLRDREVMDACLLRGLPVTITYPEMRQCLTNHLAMIRSLKSRLHSRIPSEGYKLFILQLSALRHHLGENARLRLDK